MFDDLANLFYPKICSCCNAELARNENIVCTSCLYDLPLTNFHLQQDNPVKKTFYGRAPVAQATSLLFFRKKGKVQELIHNLKYRGHEEIGGFLGEWMGNLLLESGNYNNINSVIPVPVHRRKLKLRGYNQVTLFGEKIASILNAEFRSDVLVKKSATETQTLKSRLSRWGNMEEIFVLENPAGMENKHILLVDDIITTGATLEACINKLHTINGVKVSLATMAFTN
ncbi:phosphoribosyltransferase family protein [Zunongwangia sp. F363]|uniref:Phosphoribosyltransferase family protein n=1 Tax=Autumnicola tepida TaxID=3075595 RepID=A0ABU3CA09_9FLAO|nr:phosphoribosyltransferase family protein [Zunongwangia sp. F363]MDT0643156.1 phosphoribosyltransferase family protein [Zunongwangia sp. F363]